ncbi:metalloendoproteinase 1-MMP-like [Rhodamnia argentea]|uniref:Metalloendoproteinase 1-MMP-like n=1 Tax=Rhodamnia argentea TaxID=178133 RepID=A0A8B8NSD2_9MYRT|nr:metalloendoproteinase 1-MMP-like [Rhodamnia argentea]
MPPMKNSSFVPSQALQRVQNEKLSARQTPRTQNPKAMHRSFNRLSSLAFLFLLLSRPGSTARVLPDPAPGLAARAENATWHGFARFLDAGKGAEVAGMSELKRYFNLFGYLSGPDSNFTDVFDGELQSALIAYQTRLGLPVTGQLDSSTMSAITTPRCGVSDATTSSSHALHTTRHYAYFYGRPRWARGAPATLTYAFSPSNMISYLSTAEVRAAFGRAFARWAAVIPMSFEEVEDYEAADVRIGFYRGDHGDGEPFDGVLGVLAHAFSPENGRFHLDAAETWAVDFEREKSRVAVDLETVATHEIGHVLGLAHSTVTEAVMYPSLSPRTRKVDLRMDDVDGVQALYGSNPNFKLSSFLESEKSSSSDHSVGLGTRLSEWTAPLPHLVPIVIVVVFFCLC